MTEGVRILTALAEEVRTAAELVAKDWPSITTGEDLYRDLQLRLFEDESSLTILEELPEYRRKKFLTGLAKDLVSHAVAEYHEHSGNTVYSVSQVRYLLESGGLVNSRVKVTAELPDLDEGCQYLRKVLPLYARAIYVAYVYGNRQALNKEALDAAVQALTDCMNNLNVNRRERVGFRG